MPQNQLDLIAMQRNRIRAESMGEVNTFISREIADRLLSRLMYINHDPRVVLNFSSDSGYTYAALQERYSQASVININDFSETFPSMQGVCTKGVRLPIRTQSVDMIFSNLLLPWVNDLSPILTEWRRVLKPGGLLLFSSLGPDTLVELKSICRELSATPRVHEFYDMHDFGDELLSLNFVDPVVDANNMIVLYRNLPDLFADLKGQAAQNCLLNRAKGLMTKAMLDRIVAGYETYRNDEGKLPVTFEVVYGHAWGNTLTSQQSGNEVRFSLDNLR
jgi:malonyl-CoA O-methyltransferase